MPTPLTVLAFGFAAVGLLYAVAALGALRRGRWLRLLTRLTLSLLLLTVAALFAGIGVALRGYQALTHEAVAAVVRTEPAGARRFKAHFQLADGRKVSYTLAGDELYVDAHILKWKPVANVFGLHTAYELDRVAGRYSSLADEQRAPRTVHALSPDRPVDLFTLRRRYALLAPVLDAEYGSASFAPAEHPQTLELRVSTTGLLLRRVAVGDADRDSAR